MAKCNPPMPSPPRLGGGACSPQPGTATLLFRSAVVLGGLNREKGLLSAKCDPPTPIPPWSGGGACSPQPGTATLLFRSAVVLGGLNREKGLRCWLSVIRRRLFHRGQEVARAPRSRGRLRYFFVAPSSSAA